MNILITGIAGFIGTNLALELSKEHDVMGCDIITNSPNIETVCEAIGYDNYGQGDYFIAPRPARNLDTIIHLASFADPALYQKLPIQTLELGARSIDFFRWVQIHHPQAYVIYASSSEIYGDYHISRDMIEDHPDGIVNPTGPRSMYTESKRFSEAVCEAYRKEGLKIGTARIFNTYGPHFHPEDQRVIPSWIRAVHEGRPIVIHGGGQQSRSFMYVDDLVRAFKFLIYNQASGVYNIGNPTQKSRIIDLSDLFMKKFKMVTPQHQTARSEEVAFRIPRIEKMKHLGWEPYVNLDQGIDRTWEWWTKKNLSD